MTTRCAAHALAVGPDGLCVLCRRESAVVAAPAPTSSDGDGSALLPVVLASFFGLAFVGGAIGVGLFLASASTEEHVAAAGRGVRDGHDYSRDDRERPAAQRDEASSGTNEALVSARSQVEIEVFSASWCGACRSARRYLDQNEIRYRVRDIDSEPAAQQQLAQLNPRRSIPVITFDGQNPMVGFDPGSLERRLNEAARRRMGTL